MYLRRAKLMTLKLDNDRNLRQGARGDVQPKTSKMFRHAYIRVWSSETSESYSLERGAKRTLSWWLVAVVWGNRGKGVAAGGVDGVGGEMAVVERQPWRWWSASVRDGGDGCGCGVAVLVVTVAGTKGGIAASGGE
nr:hypothetical protein [Tanacetum cinerariifolium]